MRGGHLAHQVIVMDGEQQGVAGQVVTGRDKTLGQQFDILVIEREASIALSCIVGDDETGFVGQVEGLRGLLHFDHDTAAGLQVVDGLDDKLLAPAKATPVGIGLRNDELAVSVRGVDDRHTLLLDPYVAKLTDSYRGSLLVQGVDDVFPGGVLHIVFL